jgi:cytosol alanyl aminopeptidase
MKALPAVFLMACAGAPAAAPPAAKVQLPAPPPLPKLRLGRDVIPTRYAADLTIIPTAAGFDGTVDIDVTLAAPTTGIWMNANQIDVTGATIGFAGASSAARVLPGDDAHLGLAADRVVGPGPAHVHIAYRGKLQPTETQGVFRQQSGDDWYVTTQFEETDARRAFPCFDDPSFKTPWQLTLRVPKGQVAVSNASIATQRTEGDLQVVRFDETKPLPSYLVAFAVGPYEIVDGGKTRSGVPVRIFAFKGRAAEAAYAAEVTRQVLDSLEGYFGVPYPYGKLDEVPIPKTVAFGAMENAGMVTYVDGLLLARKEDETLEQRKRYLAVCAHELAHQWFGDLVTLAWWNDTWLNESFASWMGAKIVATLAPEWRPDLDRVVELSRSLDGDTLSTSRSVRQPIESEHDIANAFDNITYGKGSAVLAMFESFLGPEAFRHGVKRYLEKHSHGNATAADFFAALSAAAGRDVAPMMSSFLDQAGEPIVTVELACPSGGQPRLQLSQKRNLLPGQAVDDRLWQVPVCVRTDAGRACTVLAERKGTLELDGACPAWVWPNAGATGYYRTVLGGDLLARLMTHRARLTPSETVDLAGDLGALLNDAAAPAKDVLLALSALGPADEDHLAKMSVQLLGRIRAELVPPELRPAFARQVARLFGARARALGLTPRKGERPEDAEMRAEIVRFVAVEGDDKRLQAEAHTLALRWLDDRQAIHPDLVTPILEIAAATAPDPQAFFDRLRAALERTTEPHERQRMIAALTDFRDPRVLRQALDLTLAPTFDIRESLRVFSAQAYRLSLEDDVYDWVKAHHDALVERIPRIARAGLMRTGLVLCDPEKLKDFESFFGERAQKLLGGPRIYRNTVESIKSCIQWRDVQMPSVAQFLHGT